MQFENYKPMNAAALKKITFGFTPVIDSSVSKDKYFPLDLSANNEELKTLDVSSSSAMQLYISNLLKKNNAKVAFGGYLEKRNIYKRSSHFNKQEEESERNIHLGIDLWIEADTEVLAVLDGRIHSFQDNTNFGDYGPTIIVEHIYDSETFYTLYGHLSRDSLKGLYLGKEVQQGEVIARLGEAEVNGDYSPHLHFQIILDIGEFKGDYPGVCSKQDVDFYIKNCPNPNLLLNL